jgi:LuxR family maltose regulon positive regulatory protein
MKSTVGVLASKLMVPSPRRDMEHRPRLIDQVAAGVSARLTLLVAPAGFGTTTLLSAWCVSDSGRTTPHA